MGNKHYLEKENRKRYFFRRARKIERRKRRAIERKIKTKLLRNNQIYVFTTKKLKKKSSITLRVPKSLCFFDNYNETLYFFKDLEKKARIYDYVRVKFRGLNKLDESTLLYFLALIDKLKIGSQIRSFNILLNINGISIECEHLLKESGFINFSNAIRRTPSVDSEYFAIHTGSSKDIQTVIESQDFVEKHLGNCPQIIKPLYTVLNEMMANVCEHAYENKDDDSSKWYIMARYDKTNEMIKFVLLDNGRGIPRTIRKTFIEKGRELVNFEKEDCKLTLSALKGEHRSETNQEYRGKGLPSVLDYAKKQNTMKLSIITGNAWFSDVQKSIFEEKKDAFNGTLYNWSLSLYEYN